MSNGIAALASSAVLLAATALWVTFAQNLAKVSEATTTTTTGSSFNKETSKPETATAKSLNLKQQHANAKPGPLSDFLPCKVTAVNRWKAR